MSFTWYESLESTNIEIKKAIAQNKAENTLFAAFRQTKAYGRQGRCWDSPLGGLYMSILLRPEDYGVSRKDIPTLSLAISIAIKRVLASRGLKQQTRIKWPNDVLLSGKKVAGISVELVEGAVCVGIGINVFRPYEKQSPTHDKVDQDCYKQAYLASFLEFNTKETQVLSDALSDVQKKIIQNLAKNVSAEVYSVYVQWIREGFSHLRNEYLESAALLGHKVRLLAISNNVLNEGTVCDINAQGALVLERDDGERMCASSGEVHLV